MRRIFLFSVLLALGMSFSSACNKPTSAESSTETGNAVSMSMSAGEITEAEKLRTAMRKVWEDHVVWTRNVIFCLTDNLPGTDQAVARLMNNQEDIGNAIKPFYGDEAGNKLIVLLKEHISGAAAVVNAAKANDTKALTEANKLWFINADEISAFLSGANPHWKLEDMKKMMHDHLNLTIDEATARIKKDYKADIVTYDKVHDEILMMADMLSEGIIKQFPDKFKKEM